MCAPYNAARVEATEHRHGNGKQKLLYVRSWDSSLHSTLRWKAIHRHLKASKASGPPVIPIGTEDASIRIESSSIDNSMSTRRDFVAISRIGGDRSQVLDVYPRSDDAGLESEVVGPVRMPAPRAANLKLITLRQSPAVFCRPTHCSVMSTFG